MYSAAPSILGKRAVQPRLPWQHPHQLPNITLQHVTVVLCQYPQETKLVCVKPYGHSSGLLPHTSPTQRPNLARKRADTGKEHLALPAPAPLALAAGPLPHFPIQPPSTSPTSLLGDLCASAQTSSIIRASLPGTVPPNACALSSSTVWAGPTNLWKRPQGESQTGVGGGRVEMWRSRLRLSCGHVADIGSTRQLGVVDEAVARRSVHEPSQTCLVSVDALIPIGRGQRVTDRTVTEHPKLTICRLHTWGRKT